MRIATVHITWAPEPGEPPDTAKSARLQVEGSIGFFTVSGRLLLVDMEWLYWLAESVEVYERERTKPHAIGERLHADQDITGAYQADDDETEH